MIRKRPPATSSFFPKTNRDLPWENHCSGICADSEIKAFFFHGKMDYK
jgi:hypothetical protein